MMMLANLMVAALAAAQCLASPFPFQRRQAGNETPPGDDASKFPTEFGMVLFPSFQAIDVFGPLDQLIMLSWQRRMNLHLIAETMDPVSTAARSASMNKFNSSFAASIVPTHTFETAPPLDVLFVPGGTGTRAPDLNATIDFVRSRFPLVQYLVTVCTGAQIAARAGVLDGKNATTNKNAWEQTTALGPKTNWIAQARWVGDGNVWSTSGLTAGMDGTLAWVDAVYGKDVADQLARMGEYTRETDTKNDPWAGYYNITDVPPKS